MHKSFQRNPIQPFCGITNVVVLAQAAMLLVLGLGPHACADTSDQANGFVFERDNRIIVLEPFGPMSDTTFPRENATKLFVKSTARSAET
jgi:hypothetical protein